MPRDPFVELEELLRDERDAIRALDGARVLAYAARKEALLAELRGADGSVSPETAARLRALSPALQNNGILLAHARDILRDALSAARSELGTAIASHDAKSRPTARILSVRG